jgi:hypothetical protein
VCVVFVAGAVVKDRLPSYVGPVGTAVLHAGIPYEERADDPELHGKRTEVCFVSAGSTLCSLFGLVCPPVVVGSLYQGLCSPHVRLSLWVWHQIIVTAAKKLDECQMIRYDEVSGQFGVTDLGRTASHFYVQV